MPLRGSRRRLLHLLLAVILCGTVWGCYAQQRAFQFLRQESGLQNVVITAIAQDAQRQIWIGTENGLYRFDGARVHAYGKDRGITDPRIINIHQDVSGALWVATATALFRREREQFVHVNTGGAQPIALQIGQSIAMLPSGIALLLRREIHMLRREGADWRLTPAFGPTGSTHRPPFKDVTSVMADANGGLWFGCDLTICHLREGELTAYYRSTDGPPITRLLQGSDGTIWGRSAGHLWRVDQQTKRIQPLELPAAKGGATWAPPLTEDRQHRILTLHGGGVARWDGRRFELISAAQGLDAAGGVSAILASDDGGVWLGTLGAGLAHWLGYEHVESWGHAEGLPSEEAWAFARGKSGDLYIGTAEGLLIQKPKGVKQQIIPKGPEGAAIFTSSLAEDHAGQMWLGSFDGALHRYTPQTSVLSRIAELPRITRLITAPGGQIWVVTHRGIYWVEDPLRDPHPRRVDEALFTGEPTPQANDACLAGDGKVWITTQAGLLVGEGGQVRRAVVSTGHGAKAPKDLLAIACDTDGLWVSAGASELWRVHIGGTGAARMDRLAAAILGQRSILSLLRDRRGWLWVGTDYGVAVSNMSQWRLLREDAGLPWNDTNQGALFEDFDGSIWLGTSRRAAHLINGDALFKSRSMDVRGEAGSDLVPDSAGPALTLPWNTHALTFHMSSGLYEQRGALAFEFKMNGLEERWRRSAEGEVTYPALPPGRYRFDVRALNADMQIESPVASFPLEVLPPWWRTTWFYLLIFFAALAAAWSAHRIRLHRVLRRQAQLETLVAARTREIEASHAQMKELALKDGLTGVLNRRALGDALNAEVSRAARGGHALTVVLIDADRFKRINDEFGHQAGDAVLIAIARRLAEQTRPYDHLGRYGGEEFVLILPELDLNTPEGRRRIEAFHDTISLAPIALPDGRPLRVTCSFGATCMPASERRAAELLIRQADEALYRAKENGRNRIEYDHSTLD